METFREYLGESLNESEQYIVVIDNVQKGKIVGKGVQYTKPSDKKTAQTRAKKLKDDMENSIPEFQFAKNIKVVSVDKFKGKIEGLNELKLTQKSKVTVYDNGGKTLDRYTVVVSDFDEYGVSKSFYSMSPDGSVDMFNGTDADGYTEGRHLGKKLNRIPTTIKDMVKNRL